MVILVSIDWFFCLCVYVLLFVSVCNNPFLIFFCGNIINFIKLKNMKGLKIIVIENLEDHVGYKENQVLTITSINEDSFISVLEGGWYIGLEEVAFV